MKALIYCLVAMGVFPVLAADQRQKVSASVKKELLAVFETNERLHRSFFDGKRQEISRLAGELDVAIEKISEQKIKELLKFSQKKLREISADSAVEENNQRYHLVSMALIHILNIYDIDGGYNAYSCPMVKMKWVQNSAKLSQVHNPYAAEMPHCGSKDSVY